MFVQVHASLLACGRTSDTPSDAPARGEDPTADGPQEDPTGADGQRDRTLELGASCENPQDGYRIGYPTSWHANDGEVTEPCRVFDVAPPEVAPNTVLPLASSVLLLVEPWDLARMRELIDDDPATDVGGLVDTEIGGRAAVRVDGHATGETYLDAGIEVHRTYVDLGGRTLVAQASELGEPDPEVRREVITAMLRTLEAIERSAPDTAGDDEVASEDGAESRSEEPAEDGAEARAEERVAMVAHAGREPRSGGDGRDPLTDGRAYLVDVRGGHHDGFARLTLGFDEAAPTYEVAPTDGPILAFPSGEGLGLVGSHYLEVVTSGTRVDLTGDEPVETYDGPSRIEGPGAPIVEVAMSGDHHGEMTWVIGMDGSAPFAVAELEDPARLVIDVVDQDRGQPMFRVLDPLSATTVAPRRATGQLPPGTRQRSGYGRQARPGPDRATGRRTPRPFGPATTVAARGKGRVSDREPTDAEIILRSLDDPAAFAAVFDRHYDAIQRFLWTRVGRRAEDVTSEVFKVAFQQRERYDPSFPSARPWLFGIASRLAKQQHRQEARGRDVVDRMGQLLRTSRRPARKHGCTSSRRAHPSPRR